MLTKCVKNPLIKDNTVVLEIMPKLRVFDSATELLYILDVSEEDSQKASQDATYAMQLLNNYKANDDSQVEASDNAEEIVPELSDPLSGQEKEGFADGFRWPHEAILLLLKYYKEQKHHMATGKMTQKKFWSMVASELSKKGYVVTGSQCKSKISGLRNTYKNIKAHRNERYRRTWHYYEILDKLYQNKETSWADLETVDDDQSLLFSETEETKKKINKRDSSLLEGESASKRLRTSEDIIGIMEGRANERRKMHEEAMARQDSLLDILKKTICVTEKSLLQRRLMHEEAMARQDKLLNMFEKFLHKNS